jgi:oligopeptide transport system substrate-binding protein
MHFLLRFLFTIIFTSGVAQGKILHLRMEEVPVSLDWNGLGANSEAVIMNNICEGLYGLSYPSKTFVPKLASALKKSKDFTVYTFTIRKNAKWSDGRRVYAKDFLDSWLRTLSPQTSSIYAYYLFDIENAKEFNQGNLPAGKELGVTVKDDEILIVKLKHPIRNWENNTGFWPFFPVRQDLIEKFGAKAWSPGSLISPGPFEIESYSVGTQMTLKRNKHYYAPAQSNVDQVILDISQNHESALADYEAHKLDILGSLPAKDFKTLSLRSDFQYTDKIRVTFLGLNADRFPTNNKIFRQGLFSAIDRSSLLQLGMTKLIPVFSMVQKPLPGSEKPSSIAYDPDQAQRLISRSGVLVDKKLKLSLLIPITEPFASIGQAIHDQISKVLSINSDVSAVQGNNFLLYSGLGEYNGFVNAWTAKTCTSQDFLLPFTVDSGAGRTHLKNAFYDDLVSQGISADTKELAAHSFFEAEKIISQDEATILPLFGEKTGVLVHPNLRKIYFDNLGLPVLQAVQIQ